jgi:hypothetical protein
MDVGFSASFQGHGSDQSASLRRQMAAFTDDPAFLAPASWPAHGCLINLRLVSRAASAAPHGGPMCGPAAALMLQQGLQTTSVVSLDIRIAPCADPTNVITDPADLSALTRLTNLTSLILLAGTPSSSDPLVLAIGQLRSLQQLDVE